MKNKVQYDFGEERNNMKKRVFKRYEVQEEPKKKKWLW